MTDSVGRLLGAILNKPCFAGVRVLRADTVRQMMQNATGNMRTLRGPGWGYTLSYLVSTQRL